MGYIRLYCRYFSMHVRSLMQYKVSFVFTVIGQIMTSFSTFLGIYFMFTRYNEVRGFAYPEVLLCFSVVLMAFSLAECFARGFDSFASVIGNGTFDRIMVRPRAVMFQVLATKIELSRVGRLLQAVVMLFYAIPASGVEWTVSRALTVLFMITGGTVVFIGLFIIYASFCFFTLDGLEFMNIFTDGGREFGRYPFSVYGKDVLRFFTFVVPLALFQYWPLLYVIGRSDNIAYMFAPLLACLFLTPCFLFWNIGMKKYKSTGS